MSMIPERWQQIRVVLQDALELPPHQRSGFVAKACSDDPALRQEVESFLALEDEVRFPPTIGETISHYRIVAELGSGGMGVVYKAEDVRLQRFVALKFLPENLCKDRKAVQRFEREARSASSLNHPNICTIYEVEEHETQPVIVMELLHGENLKDRIRKGPLPTDEVIDLGTQIADALEAAHIKGIIHRDIKPANIFVVGQNWVKVLDFGLAKALSNVGAEDQREEESLTMEGAVLGTSSYMSPEQVRGEDLDGRSDLFSLGVVLYELTTGKRPFVGKNRITILDAILHVRPESPTAVNPSVPKELDTIISKALEKSPDLRYQHASELRSDLQQLKRKTESSSKRFQSASDLAFAREALSDSGIRSTATPVRRRKWWYAIITIAILILGGVVGSTLWFLRVAHNTPEPNLTAVPLTTYLGFQSNPSFSPDGNQVAFAWNGDKQDNFDIYVKLIGTSGPPLRLTTDPFPDYDPAWSPDGRFIAFVSCRPRNKSAVMIIPALGGPERKIAEISTPGEEPGPHLAWSPDGNSLVISDRDSLTDPLSLFLLSITGEKRRLTFPPASSIGDTSPALSPDGHTLAFSRRVDPDINLGDLYTLNLVATSEGLKPAGQVKRITFENRGARSPAWTSDGHEIVFADQTGIRRIYPSASAQARQIKSIENIEALTVSRHSQRLSYAHMLFHSSISRLIAPVLDADHERRTGPQSHSISLISSTRNDSAPQYSGDGKKVVFASERSGNQEIWSCDNDGSNARQLTSFGGPQVTTPRWSPDSSRIAFDSNAKGEYDIWVIDADGARPQRMTTHPANDGNPSWSPDGRWIYFDSARTGEQQVWKIPANGGEAIQVTRDGGFAPLESADGKFVYYLKRLRDTQVWRISTEGARVTKVLEGLSDYRNLAVVRSGLIFVPIRNISSLEFLNFATHKIRTLANVDRPIFNINYAGLTVSPDAQSILYTEIRAGSELMLMENFR